MSAVPHDRADPRRALSRLPQAVPRPDRLDERVLHGIFGQVVVPQYGERRTEALRSERSAAILIVLEVGGRAEPRTHLRIPVGRADVAAFRHIVHAEIGMSVELREKPFSDGRMDVPLSEVERSWSD